MTAFIGATGSGDVPTGLDRVQDDLRRRPDALRDHARHEHDLDPARPQVPGGLRVSSAQAAARPVPISARASNRRTSSAAMFLGCSSLSLTVGLADARVLVDTLIDGLARASTQQLFTNPPSADPGRGRRPAGDPRHALPRSCSLIAFSRADRRRDGDLPRGVREQGALVQPRCSRSTSRTSPPCRRSSTASSGSRSSSAGSGSVASLLAGALILTLVVLPTVIIASREAIRAVPDSIRQGALALGATKWQVVCAQVLPAAIPGIATGSILALSRAHRRDGAAAPGRRAHVRRRSTRRCSGRTRRCRSRSTNWIEQPAGRVPDCSPPLRSSCCSSSC